MITVFTSTYNRGYIIENLYQSLKRQTSKDFEWIVIDDGSTDNTESLLFKWKNEEANFPIKYKKIKNGGKHKAINIGVSLSSADAFFIVDSDDFLVENAIEEAQTWFQAICEKPQYAGVSGLRGYTKDNPIGGWGTFSNAYIDATNLERETYGLLGDKAEIYKTEILKKYPFPEFKGENFLTEAIVWDRIAIDGFKIRWYQKIIYICDYLEDGLTHSGYAKSIKNPKGYLAYLNLISQIYGKEYADKKKFGFYFVSRSANSFNACMDKMQISLECSQILEATYQQMILEMKKYFAEHNIKNIAIYGLGNVGNAFIAASDNLNLNIKYAIDRRETGYHVAYCENITPKSLNVIKVPVYSPKSKFPPVDAVIITLKDYNEKIKIFLQKYFDVVVYWKDISLKYWID